MPAHESFDDLFDSADSEIDALFNAADSEVSGLETTAESEAEKAAAANLLRMGRDRSWIAITIIVTYAAAIIVMFLYILFTVPSCGDGVTIENCEVLSASWDKQTENLLNVVTIAILPIVTLMLGFYFGTERAAASTSESLQS